MQKYIRRDINLLSHAITWCQHTCELFFCGGDDHDDEDDDADDDSNTQQPLYIFLLLLFLLTFIQFRRRFCSLRTSIILSNTRRKLGNECNSTTQTTVSYLMRMHAFNLNVYKKWILYTFRNIHFAKAYITQSKLMYDTI